MAIKNVYLKKKIAGVVYDIYPRSSAEMIDYDGSTVAAKLASLATGIADAYTKAETETKLTELYNKIMGFTGADKTINEAYDTLKEVATWLDANSDVKTLINNLAGVVGDSSNGLVKDVADLQAALNTAGTGLLARMTAAETAITAVEGRATALEGRMKTAEDDIDAVEGRATALEGRMTTAETDIDAVEGRATALEGRMTTAEADIDALQAVGATKVEASSTNGNIKINGVETTVYNDSAIAASKIVESNERKFVTASEKALIKDYIQYVATADKVTEEGVLYMVDA